MTLEEMKEVKTEGYRLSFIDWRNTQDAQQVIDENYQPGFTSYMDINSALIKGYRLYLEKYPLIEKELNEDLTKYFPSELRGMKRKKNKIYDYYVKNITASY